MLLSAKILKIIGLNKMLGLYLLKIRLNYGILLLKEGDTEENVKVLQTALGVKADGVFGSKTEEAVKPFQKS